MEKTTSAAGRKEMQVAPSPPVKGSEGILVPGVPRPPAPVEPTIPSWQRLREMLYKLPLDQVVHIYRTAQIRLSPHLSENERTEAVIQMLVDAHDQQMKGVQWDEVRAIEELEKELEERRPPMQVADILGGDLIDDGVDADDPERKSSSSSYREWIRGDRRSRSRSPTPDFYLRSGIQVRRGRSSSRRHSRSHRDRSGSSYRDRSRVRQDRSQSRTGDSTQYGWKNDHQYDHSSRNSTSIVPNWETIAKFARRIYFRHLNRNVGHKELVKYFAEIGKIRKICLFNSQKKGKEEIRQGYLEFKEISSVDKALTMELDDLFGSHVSFETYQPNWLRLGKSCGEQTRRTNTSKGNAKQWDHYYFDQSIGLFQVPKRERTDTATGPNEIENEGREVPTVDPTVKIEVKKDENSAGPPNTAASCEMGLNIFTPTGEVVNRIGTEGQGTINTTPTYPPFSTIVAKWAQLFNTPLEDNFFKLSYAAFAYQMHVQALESMSE